MFRRWRGYLPRRGKFFPVVPAQAVTPPPTRVPSYIDQAGGRPRWATLARRGRFIPVPARPSQASPQIIQPDSVRWRTTRTRRGVFLAIVPKPVAPTPPPPAVPATVRGRVRVAVFARRGRFFTIPLVGQAPVPPPAIPPQMLRERVRMPWSRRGRYLQPPWPQGAAPIAPAWVPPLIRQHQPGLRIVRRGRFTPIVPSTYGVPSRVVSRRPPNQPGRRSRFWQPPWRLVPPGQPGPLAPRIITQPRRPPARPTRRGMFIPPPAPVLAGYSPLVDPAGQVHRNSASAAPRTNPATAALTNRAAGSAGENPAAATTRSNDAEATP